MFYTVEILALLCLTPELPDAIGLFASVPVLIGFVIPDDAMAPLFVKGETVYATKSPFENNTTCLVAMPDGTSIVRNVRLEGSEYVLIPLDQQYPVIRLSRDGIDEPLKVVQKKYRTK